MVNLADALRLCPAWRPAIDPPQRLAHQNSPVAVGQAVGDAKRLDSLLVCQQRDGSGPVGAPHAAIESERVKDAAERIPQILVGEWLVRQRAGAGDLDRDVI